jgi:hypothetical protein
LGLGIIGRFVVDEGLLDVLPCGLPFHATGHQHLVPPHGGPEHHRHRVLDHRRGGAVEAGGTRIA